MRKTGPHKNSHFMKRALVTGGSGNIGAAICRRLARDGLHVIVHANRNRELAETVTGEIRAAGAATAPPRDSPNRTMRCGGMPRCRVR